MAQREHVRSAPRAALEQLESRRVLAAFSVQWPEPTELTISFAPDGTLAGDRTSQLFNVLDQYLPRAVWQETIVRAFQTWVIEANTNLAVTSDGGQPFGTLGFKQGDPRFGDIRIGAVPMAADVIAVANPYDPFVANTWVGDVFLNTNFVLGTSGQDAADELFEIMLHEAGHVLGVGHSDDPNSPMYEHFQSHSSQTLTLADVAALRAILDARKADAQDRARANDSLATATDLEFAAEASSFEAALAGDITRPDDLDVYRLVAPVDHQPIEIEIQAAGVSSLVPRVTVFDSHGQVVETQAARGPLDNDVRLRLDSVAAGEEFYVLVAGARDDVYGIGAYHLAVVAARPGAPPDAGEPIPASSSPTPVLLATTPWYVEHTYYEEHDTIDRFHPAVSYQVRSADFGPDLNNVFTVVVTAEHHEAPLTIAIFDDAGRPVPYTWVSQEPHRWELRVEHARSNADYVVEVSAPGQHGSIEVEVEVDFAQDATHFETFVNHTLERGDQETLRTLVVNQSQLFHLVLGASDWSLPGEVGVRMTIINDQGRAVFEQSVPDGAVRSFDVLLDPGVYTVRFTRANPDGQGPVWIVLSGGTQSSPLGPQLRDTITAPAGPSESATLAELSFYWLPFDAASDVPSVRALALAALLKGDFQATTALPARTAAAPLEFSAALADFEVSAPVTAGVKLDSRSLGESGATSETAGQLVRKPVANGNDAASEPPSANGAETAVPQTPVVAVAVEMAVEQVLEELETPSSAAGPAPEQAASAPSTAAQPAETAVLEDEPHAERPRSERQVAAVGDSTRDYWPWAVAGGVGVITYLARRCWRPASLDDFLQHATRSLAPSKWRAQMQRKQRRNN
ncbi:MAG: matrixin family metalloprotease [Pirellulales bacterium]|nr:matrixin family metalloprotease [Pirellulales bacterium]